jgi:hypothetical protein
MPRTHRDVYLVLRDKISILADKMIALPACDVWIHEKALFKILRLLFPCGRLSATQPQP